MPSLGTLDLATAVVEGALELASSDWADLSGAPLLDAAAALARARGLLDAALVAAAERLEVTDAAGAVGWSSAKEFLTHLTGGHRGEGGGFVRAGEQMRDLPDVRAALVGGEVTLPQARAIAADVVTLPREGGLRQEVAGRLLAMARTEALGATALRNAFGAVVREVDPEGHLVDLERGRARAERSAHHERHLSIVDDSRGGVRIRGYGTVEQGTLLRAVLLPLAAPVASEPGACGGTPAVALAPGEKRAPGRGCPDVSCFHDGRDPRSGSARLWDALVHLAESGAAEKIGPTQHGARPTVVVLIDEADLRQRVADADAADGHDRIRFGSAVAPSGVVDAHFLDGAPVSVHAVRRLACDAGVLPVVLGGEGQVLDVGRTRRLVTPGLWSALVVRDRHCAFPGCTRPPSMSDAHHIQHWSEGGATSLDNLVLLCGYHHTVIHRSPWRVEIDAGTGRPRWTPPPRSRPAAAGLRDTHPPPRVA